MAECRGFAVPRHEGDVIAQREELVSDRIDQQRQLPVRVLPGADRVAEQYVADEGLAPALAEIGDMAFAVARAVQHFELFLTEADPVAVLEPARRFVALCWHAVFLAHLLEPTDDMRVSLV